MQPDCSKIKAGMQIKNLREFCELTGLEYKDSTNSRNAITALLSRYFDWEKKGRSFAITRVKSLPDPEPFHGNDLFSEDVRIVLEAFFYSSLTPMMFSKTELARVCGFVNPFYRTKNQPDCYELFPPEKFSAAMVGLYLDKTSDLINGYCISHLSSSLERLEARGLIFIERKVYVREEIETEIASRDGGESHKTTVSVWRNPTDREANIHRLMFEKFKESRGLTYVNSSTLREYDKFRGRVYKRLGIAESREFLRIGYTGEPTLYSYDEAAEAYGEAKRRINDRVLVHCLSKVPGEVEKGLKNYLNDLMGEGTQAIVVPLMHTSEQETEAREAVVRLLIGFNDTGLPLDEARKHSEMLQDIDPVSISEDCPEEERKQMMEFVANLRANFEEYEATQR